jgi:hypothetical protein
MNGFSCHFIPGEQDNGRTWFVYDHGIIKRWIHCRNLISGKFTIVWLPATQGLIWLEVTLFRTEGWQGHVGVQASKRSQPDGNHCWRRNPH